MSRPVAVAILGAGIGGEHLAAYQTLPELFSVHTLCDLDAERAGAASGDAPVQIETDLAAVLRDPSIDCVDICLPPHLHCDIALAALAAGKHVICEKPLACSLRDVDRMIAAAEDTGRRIFPVFQYRFGRALDQLAALRDAGLAGRAFVASLETHWNRGADYYAAPWRGTWAGELGGAVLGHAIHVHDLLLHVLGPVRRVSALAATRVNPVETEDCAAVVIEMQGGALVTSSITLGAATDTTRLRLVFEGLTAESGTSAYAPASDTWIFTARNPRDQARVDAIAAAVPDTPQGFTGLLVEVAKALDGAASRAVLLADARRSIELVTAIYRSSRTSSPVALPLGREDADYAGWHRGLTGTNS